MQSLVGPVAIAGTLATTLMVVAMLYFVWVAMGDDTHSPSPGKTEAEVPDVAEEETAPESVESEPA